MRTVHEHTVCIFCGNERCWAIPLYCTIQHLCMVHASEASVAVFERASTSSTNSQLYVLGFELI